MNLFSKTLLNCFIIVGLNFSQGLDSLSTNKTKVENKTSTPKDSQKVSEKISQKDSLKNAVAIPKASPAPLKTPLPIPKKDIVDKEKVFSQNKTQTQSKKLNSLNSNPKKEAIYQRPFIGKGENSGLAVGGYFEGNTNYFSEDGVSEGFSMEARRFNIFLFSSIHPRIRFLSELEFEHGVEEIALETAVLDFEIHPAAIFRAGILLAPIGDFNQNHDSPKWEFIDRPLVSTEIIPSTLSEVAFGLLGKYFFEKWGLGYHLYLVNGLGDGIIGNEEGKILTKFGKSLETFEEDNNGLPMVSGKLTAFGGRWGELGLSYYGGTYNSFQIEGEPIFPKRKLQISAANFSLTIKKLTLKGEGAFNYIELPPGSPHDLGSKQWGAFLETVYPILSMPILSWRESVLNFILRGERVDFNLGNFTIDNIKIGDEVTALVSGLSLRLTTESVIKFNYRYHWITDDIGNPANLGGFQFGIATYF